VDVIKIENLSFSYEENQKPVINNLSLTVKSGEFLAVVGRNASGKSTLARLITGLLTPNSGKIEVLGIEAKKPKELFEIRKKVGIVFQNPDNQMVASIVEDDVAFGPENIGVRRDEIGERVEFALKATGVEPFRRSMASKLSGGQKQRVAIAGVLAIKPQIIILDESTSMLDPRGRNEVMSVVKELNKNEGMTVIAITHYMDEVTECDRVAVMIDGNIQKIGTPEQIFNDEPLLERAGLEQPNAMKLAKSLKQKGVKGLDGVTDKESLLNALIKTLNDKKVK
jgi:energy-coupling factor transport system ATP-binding protein